jgi:hypothetical protein
MLFFAGMLESVLFFVDTIGFFAMKPLEVALFTLISFRANVGAYMYRSPFGLLAIPAFCSYPMQTPSSSIELPAVALVSPYLSIT